jgi:hypothetical protein
VGWAKLPWRPYSAPTANSLDAHQSLLACDPMALYDDLCAMEGRLSCGARRRWLLGNGFRAPTLLRTNGSIRQVMCVGVYFTYSSAQVCGFVAHHERIIPVRNSLIITITYISKQGLKGIKGIEK